MHRRPVGVPSQRASNVETVFMLWRLHERRIIFTLYHLLVWASYQAVPLYNRICHCFTGLGNGHTSSFAIGNQLSEFCLHFANFLSVRWLKVICEMTYCVLRPVEMGLNEPSDWLLVRKRDYVGIHSLVIKRPYKVILFNTPPPPPPPPPPLVLALAKHIWEAKNARYL